MCPVQPSRSLRGCGLVLQEPRRGARAEEACARERIRGDRRMARWTTWRHLTQGTHGEESPTRTHRIFFLLFQPLVQVEKPFKSLSPVESLADTKILDRGLFEFPHGWASRLACYLYVHTPHLPAGPGIWIRTHTLTLRVNTCILALYDPAGTHTHVARPNQMYVYVST